MVPKRNKRSNRVVKKDRRSAGAEEITRLMRRAGLRPTAPRLAIAAYCLKPGRHPTIAEIREWAEAELPHVSLATIYNTVNALVRGRLLREVRLPHRSETVLDGNLERHHHFLDEVTGELRDLSVEDVEVSTRLEERYRVWGFEVLVRGRIEGSVGRGIGSKSRGVKR